MPLSIRPERRDRRGLVASAVLFVTAAAVAMAGLLFAGAAQAGPYPPSQCATLSVSTTHPAAGEPMTVTGTEFTPGQTVTLELHSDVRVVGSALVQPDGTFTTQVTIPADMYGQHLLLATGGTPSCPVDPITLQISASQIAGESVGPSGGGGLSSTGVQIALLLAIAGIALVGGLGLTRIGKAKRARG